MITLLDAKSLNLDILGAYLAYLVGGAGFTEWLKHGNAPSDTGLPPSAITPAAPVVPTHTTPTPATPASTIPASTTVTVKVQTPDDDAN